MHPIARPQDGLQLGGIALCARIRQAVSRGDTVADTSDVDLGVSDREAAADENEGGNEDETETCVF